jgi:hypothetical protein
MPFAAAIPLAISGISALGGLLANRGAKSKQDQTQNIDQLTAPEYDPQTMYMRNFLMDQYLNRIRGDEDFFGGYATEGLNQINQGSNIASQNIENILASRGLGRTTAGASSAVQNQLNRLMQQNSFLNQIPLLRDQRAQSNLVGASGFFNQLPVASRRTGTTTGETDASTGGNMLGGGFSSLATMLGGLYGVGAFDKKPVVNTGDWTRYTPKPIDYDITKPR